MANPAIPANLRFRIQDVFAPELNVPVAAMVTLTSSEPTVHDLPVSQQYSVAVNVDGTITLPFTPAAGMELMLGTAAINIMYSLPALPVSADVYHPVNGLRINAKVSGASISIDSSVYVGPIRVRYKCSTVADDGVTTLLNTSEALLDPLPEFPHTATASAQQDISAVDGFSPTPGTEVLVTLSPMDSVNIKVSTPDKFQFHKARIRKGSHIINGTPITLALVDLNPRPSVVLEEVPIIHRNGILELDEDDCVFKVNGVLKVQPTLTALAAAGAGIVVKVNGVPVTDIEFESASSRYGLISLRNLNITTTDTFTVSYGIDSTKWGEIADNLNPLYIHGGSYDRAELERNLIDGDMYISVRSPNKVYYRYAHHSNKLHAGADWAEEAWPTTADLSLGRIHLERTTPSLIDVRKQSLGIKLPANKEVIDWRSHSHYGFYGGEAVPSMVMIIELPIDIANTVRSTKVLVPAYDEVPAKLVKDAYKEYFYTILSHVLAVGSYVLIVDPAKSIIFTHEDIFDNANTQ